MEFHSRDATTPLLSSTDAQIVQQKNAGISQVVDDLRDLKDMADDMNRIVYEQQTFFDEAGKNVAEADENVSAGASEIKLASSYNASYRKKICIIVAIVTIILIILLFIILGATGVFKKKKKT